MDRASSVSRGTRRTTGIVALGLAVVLAATTAAAVSAATRRLDVTCSSCGPIVSGVRVWVTATVVDAAAGTTDAEYRGTVTFESTDPLAILPADYTFTPADAGVHIFSIELDTAGTQTITVVELSGGLPVGLRGTSPPITVLPNTATQLRFAAAPRGGVIGSPFPIQPVVYITDGSGNRVASYPPTSIRLILVVPADGWGAATLTCLGGNPRATEGAGYAAVFSGCSVDGPGRYGLSAHDSDGLLSWATTDPFDITGPTATHFVFTTVPATVTAGTAFSFSFRAATASGATDTAYRGTVQFTSTDPGFTQPARHTFTAADAGVYTTQATFARTGSQNLVVTQTDDISVSGVAAISVVAPRTADRLVWTGVPATVTSGTAAALVLSAVAADGLTVPTFTGTVHFTSTDPSATLPADYTFVAADLGVRSFTVTLRSSGTQAVTATQVGSPSVAGTTSGIAVSGEATPAPPPSPSPSGAIALTVSSRVVTYPGPVDLSIALAGGAGRTVSVQRRSIGTAAFADVATVALGPDGAGSATVTQEKNAEYRAVWPGAAGLPAATSAPILVSVRYRVVVTPAATTRTVRAGSTVSWTAVVRPSSNPPMVRFRVYRRTGSRWVPTSTTLAQAGADGRAAFRKRFPTAGRFYVEAVALGDTVNASGTAPKKYLTVR